MFSWVEPKSKITAQFSKYFLGEIIKHWPLYCGKLIEIPVMENSSSFPEITEMPTDYIKDTPISSKNIDKSIKIAGTTRNLQDNIKNRIDDTTGRNVLKYLALSEYLQSTFGDVLKIHSVQHNSENPLSLVYSVTLINPNKLIKEAQKLGLDINKYEMTTRGNNFLAPKFLENPPQIIWNDFIIPIEEGSYAFYVCIVAFKNPVGKPISWDEIVEEIEGTLKKASDIKQRSIYDAVRSLNERFEKATSKKLFMWKNLSFYRII